MRLLNVNTFQFEDFPLDPPSYAILSHTWSQDEVSYQDVLSGKAESKRGWQKVLKCCEKAADDNFNFVWVDTACIDKSNSAELSMAINSMYGWYSKSAICYVFLEDVDQNITASPEIRSNERSPDASPARFRSSRWFSRGWTLQELVAPRFVIFLDRSWTEIGTRSSLSKAISKSTRISTTHLEDISSCNIATKMSWASSRITTIPEDMAYCLLGLFGINMPLIYGEGGSKAFVRLQQELLKQTDDESILAWNEYAHDGQYFATSPRAFKEAGSIETIIFDDERPEMVVSNKGLIMNPLLYQRRERDSDHENRFIVPLNCGAPKAGSMCFVALRLEAHGSSFRRVDASERILAYPHSIFWLKEFELVGRRRVCIQHGSKTGVWKPFDDNPYAITFRTSESLRLCNVELVSGISSLSVPEKPDETAESQLSEDGRESNSLYMAPGTFAVASLATVFTLEGCKCGVAVRRCGGSLTLKSWFYKRRDEHLAMLEAHKDKAQPPNERQDFMQIRFPSGMVVEIRLRPQGSPETVKHYFLRENDRIVKRREIRVKAYVVDVSESAK